MNDGDTTGRDADLRAGVRIPRLRGVRRSSPFGADVVADSVRRTDPALADRTRAATSWRREYLTPFRRSTALAVSAPASLRIAEDGLAAVRERGVLVTGDGAEEPVGAWCARAAGDDAPPDGGLGTATVTGSAEPLRRVEVPYRGALLAGTALEQQLDRWVVGGAMEPGFADAVRRAMDHPAWLSLPGHQAVLLGAGAALGPLPWLSRWGADVTAVDVGEPAVWERLRRVAADGAGRLAAPVVGAGTPGAHLAADLAALRPWLRRRWSGDAAPVLGSYAYTDGATHVELSIAADVLAADAVEHPAGVLAFLHTPTDTFLVPEDVVEQARARHAERSWNGPLRRAARLASGRRLFAPAYGEVLEDERGARWGLFDSLVDVQGPSYALAKRIQRWRAVVNRSAGRRTSSTVAPASWTRSVTRNRLLAAAYAGAGRFGVEIFAAETTAALMAAKLVADVYDESDHAGAHPESVFSDTAVHGGLWRQPFDPRSTLGVAAVLGAPRALLGRS